MISQFLMLTTIPRNFHAAKFCCIKVTSSKLTIEFTEVRLKKFWKKSATGKVNQSVIQGVKTQIQKLFVKNLKQEVKLQE